VLLCLALLAGWAYRSQVAAARDRLWVAMARESAHQLGTPLMSLTGWIAYLREIRVPAGSSWRSIFRPMRSASSGWRSGSSASAGRPAEAVGLGALAERVVSYFRRGSRRSRVR